MERDLYKNLLEWTKSPRRKPLVLQGGRQVGKTYLLKEFGKREYKNTAYFNFEEDPKLSTFFEGRLDPHKIVEKLSIYQDQKIVAGESLLVFDEIQESENALKSLKYFQEDTPEYHLVSAGSLLGLKLKNLQPFPVGKVNFLSLYPLSFLEFLLALGKTSLRGLLTEKRDFVSIPLPFHDELVELLKTYYFVGGMPEAVSEYAKNKDFNVIRTIQKEILKSFSYDFSRHAPPHDVIKINQVWNSIPVQLGRETKKFTYTTLRPNARGRDYEQALRWLIDAGLIDPVHHVSRPEIPLAGYSDKNIFKIYLIDTGLLATMYDLTPRTLVEGNSLFTHFKGALVENYVAQELRSQHQKSLYYWTSGREAEVDFLLSYEDRVFPLEVKSGVNRRSKSLREYGKRYHPPQLYTTSLLNFQKEGGTLNYPLYAISLFPSALTESIGPIDNP